MPGSLEAGTDSAGRSLTPRTPDPANYCDRHNSLRRSQYESD